MRIALPLFLLLGAALSAGAHAQDAAELKAEQRSAGGGRAHPLEALMREKNSKLRPELAGLHPRVYFTQAEIEALRQRARTTHRALWQRALGDIRALSVEPAAPPAQARRAQNEVGLGAAEAAFAYAIERDPKYLAAAKKYLDAAVRYEVWGYRNNKPDVDLAAGHLLYGMGWAYDLLWQDLTPAERARYRDKLAAQARKMYAYFAPKPGKTYAYSQNHVFIPVAGLAVAAYALYDEVDDAPQWAALSRAIFDRVLATYSADGYYYEGFEYWIFSTPWLVHWLDAQAHATGEDLYDRPGLRHAHEYVAHSLLPDRQNIFDFGDAWAGGETRARQGEDYARTHPGGRLESNYNLLYRFAQRFGDGNAQGVARWLEQAGHASAEAFWSLAWYDAALAPTPMAAQARWHYFPDHEVVYWRSSWDADATAFAFKCGPPEGHHAAPLLERYADWRLSAGHAHPDAGSFIIYAKGAYLTGDSGYAGVPLTVHHNSMLVNGKGQGREGQGHDAWDGVPYARLDATRLATVKLGERQALIVADVAGSYPPDSGLAQFERRFEFTAPGRFTITDRIEAAAASTFTALLHADGKIAAAGGNYVIESGKARLEVAIEAPQGRQVAVEPNELIGPGPPGAVDKGEKLLRGSRLAIAAPPAASAKFAMTLTVAP